MSALMEQITRKAQELCVPLNVHLDITWRCNASCIHCYVTRTATSEMNLAEIRSLLAEMAKAGTLFLVISGGEPFLRDDLMEIVEEARKLTFSVKLKTNGTRIGAAEARRLREFSVAEVGISLYSHRPRVHDAILGLSGAWQLAMEGVRRLRAEGVRVRLACVLMRRNVPDYKGVHALAREVGAEFSIDPTVTPRIDGDTSVLENSLPIDRLRAVVHDGDLVGSVQDYCSPARTGEFRNPNELLCGAGHASCYVTPWGEVWPCVQLPIRCGDARTEGFREVWRKSEALSRLRAFRWRDLPACSQCRLSAVCSRCPGLAYLEGDLLGVSSLDCRKSYARTGMRDPRMRLSFRGKGQGSSGAKTSHA